MPNPDGTIPQDQEPQVGTAPAGPSHFVDVSSVTYNSINIYSVTNIRITRQRQVIKGEDNNKLRPVSNHTVRINETVSFETEDVYAMQQLLTQTGAHNLVFTWVPASSQLTVSPLPSQTVTVKNVVIESVNIDPVVKGLGKGSVSGTVLEVSDDTDPVTFA
jgi:hypothetical protein